MSGDDNFDDLCRPRQPMGTESWPPYLFSLPNWLRLQAHKLSVVTIQDEYFFVDLPREWTTDERKYALIIRDPLTRRYDRKLLEWLKDQGNETLAGEVGNLQQELEIKWHFRIYLPREVTGNIEKTLSRIERGLIIRPWRPIFVKPQAIRDLRTPLSRVYIDAKAGKMFITGYEHTGLIFCPPPLIPMAFDPTMLTLADAERVKKAVWDIVKTEITKLQDGKGRGWTPVSPRGEPEELAEVLRCRPANFEKYLNWYDLHLATVPFRVIANYESVIEDPERREAIYENVIGARRNPKVRHRVKGESAVRKGYDLIHFAIHRKKSLDEEDKLLLFGLFECPIHKGNTCPGDCEYLAGFIKKYEKWFKDSYRGGTPIEPRDTDQETPGPWDTDANLSPLF